MSAGLLPSWTLRGLEDAPRWLPNNPLTHLFPSWLELPTVGRTFTVPQSALFCAVFNV